MIKSQKMIKEGIWEIELIDGTIIECTNNVDFKIIKPSKVVANTGDVFTFKRQQ